MIVGFSFQGFAAIERSYIEFINMAYQRLWRLPYTCAYILTTSEFACLVSNNSTFALSLAEWDDRLLTRTLTAIAEDLISVAGFVLRWQIKRDLLALL